MNTLTESSLAEINGRDFPGLPGFPPSPELPSLSGPIFLSPLAEQISILRAAGPHLAD